MIDRRTLIGAALVTPAVSAFGRVGSSGSLTAYVDPFIGTDGTGHCFPGPSRPFGMVQPGPDNADGGWDFTSGYQYRARTIMGFSQTRASGTGIPELGDLLLMPVASVRDDLRSTYDKASEVARPGYYAIRLTDNAVRVELTAGKRVAMHRYAFGRGGRVHVLVDLQHRLKFLEEEHVLDCAVKTTADGVEGSVRSKNWTTRTMAFALRFDHPVAEAKLLPLRKGDKAPRYLLAFDLGGDGILHAKAALSTTDVEGARRNMTEVPGWDFDGVARAAEAEWAALLARATIEADDRQKRIFYTALYHLFLQPTVISDIDGRVRGPAGTIIKARGRDYYSTLSLWDTFRAAHPLYTLLVPERVDDFVLTMLDHQKVAGTLPLWTIWGGETNTMIGNPALPVIADAWAKGFRGFDGREALQAMIASSTKSTPVSDWPLFEERGYYPFDKMGNEAVSKTLEAGIGDAATARMAAMMDNTAAAAKFSKRAGNYRMLIDPETRLARGRDSAGRWRSPFDPVQVTSPLGTPGDYTEANAWQYSWTPALHDPQGLVTAMGGRAAFTAMLDRFFTLPGKEDKFQGQEALIGQYSHGNEPGHHIAWLYAHSDKPWRTPQLVAEIARRFYRDTPDGIVGNDDCGQMSAWYIFAVLGFYPAEPASGRYQLGVPMAKRATLKLAGGRTLVIEGADIPSMPFNIRTTLNGRPVTSGSIAHRDLVRGGTMRTGVAG